MQSHGIVLDLWHLSMHLQEMHLVSKVNRTQVFWVEMPHKLHGSHARKKHVNVQCVGGRLEVWPWEFVWASRILHNQECFDQKQKRFYWRFIPQPLFVQLSYLYIVGNKRKRKEDAYIFIHQCCYFSLLNKNRTKKDHKEQQMQNWICLSDFNFG